jgi:hypothetical protein
MHQQRKDYLLAGQRAVMFSDPAAVSFGNSGSPHGVREDVVWVANNTQRPTHIQTTGRHST